MPKPVVVAEVVRSGFVEGRHHGSVVALGADGTISWAVGDVDRQMLPRSCNKPLQALAMVRVGLDLPPELLALACASHSGEPFHLDGVRRVLATAGLDEARLQCPDDYPLDEQEREAVIRAGGGRTALQMNCSGKHAAMLATCAVNGWDLGSYLDVEHPLQQAIRSIFEDFTGESASVAVDGCGAPVLSASLVGLARAFRRLAVAEGGPERRVAEAIRRHPEWVSGTRRDERAVLAAVPGAIGKLGAEASEVIALADGRVFAVKIEDGGDRARPVVMAAALARGGVVDEPGVDGAALRRTGVAALFGGGREVGEIRPIGVTASSSWHDGH